MRCSVLHFRFFPCPIKWWSHCYFRRALEGSFVCFLKSESGSVVSSEMAVYRMMFRTGSLKAHLFEIFCSCRSASWFLTEIWSPESTLSLRPLGIILSSLSMCALSWASKWSKKPRWVAVRPAGVCVHGSSAVYTSISPFGHLPRFLSSVCRDETQGYILGNERISDRGQR